MCIVQSYIRSVDEKRWETTVSATIFQFLSAKRDTRVTGRSFSTVCWSTIIKGIYLQQVADSRPRNCSACRIMEEMILVCSKKKMEEMDISVFSFEIYPLKFF